MTTANKTLNTASCWFPVHDSDERRLVTDFIFCCPQLATKRNNKYFYIPASQLQTKNKFLSPECTSTLLNLWTWHMIFCHLKNT